MTEKKAAGKREKGTDREIPAEDWPTLVRWLRGTRGWDQARLAGEAGIDPSSASRYEKGKLVPPRRTVDRLAAAVGVPSFLIEACLLPAIATVRGASSWPEALDELEEVVAALERRLSDAARPQLAALLLELAREEARSSAPPSLEDHAEAAALWERLEPCTPVELGFLVENAPELHTWALAVRLAEESAKAAASDAKRSLALARLAVRVAELAPGEPAWRSRLEAFVTAFLANAHRVQNDLQGAEAAFDRASRRWSAGEGAAGSSLLPAWRLLDLEASLRRAQRRWSAALTLLDRAQAMAPPEAVGRILLNRSSILVLLGDGEGAVATLRQAAPFVDGERHPRLLSVLRFNLAANLVRLGRPAEGEALLPEVRELASGIGNELDLVRVRWLEGQIAAGLGREDEAVAAFEQVLRAFTQRKLAYDAALVGLELAVLYLEQGRTTEVRALAREMVSIFGEQKVDEETRKALALFREAAGREAATTELARRLVTHLLRVRQPGPPLEG